MNITNCSNITDDKVNTLQGLSLNYISIINCTGVKSQKFEDTFLVGGKRVTQKSQLPEFFVPEEDNTLTWIPM